MQKQVQLNAPPDEDQQYQSSLESEEEFQPPAKDPTNNQIYKKYKDSLFIKQQQEEDDELPFIIKNLDTGETVSIENEKKHIEFDRKHSFKRQQIKGVAKLSAWQNFWKSVYKNNEQLRAYAQKGELQKLKSLIIHGKNGYPVEINSKGFDDWTALHYAAYENHPEIVQFLLNNSSQINAKTKFGKTALHIASMRGQIEVIIVLCKHSIDINYQDDDGNTALHIATENSEIEVIQYLLKLTKVLIENKYGLKAIDISPNQEIKNIFLNYGYKQSQKLKQLKLNKKNDSKRSASSIREEPTKENKIERIRLPQQQLNPNSFLYYRQLGKGSFGEVFLVSKKGQQRFYAMKVLSKDKIFGKNLVRYAMAQRNVLSGMNHPFIVRLNFAFQTETKLFLVMDYCPGGDLGKVIAKRKMLPEDEARLYASELVLAFQALHKNMIVFRDLKPDNVVLDQQGHARLTDFGLSKQGVYNNTTQSFCGSIAYLAPEILNKQGHSRTIDWYLLGLLIYELIVGLPPYYNSKKQILFQNIKRGPLKIPKTMSENAKDLIKKLLCRDPKKRLGANRDAQQIKEHPFFECINWNDVLNRKLPVSPIQISKINFNETIKVNFIEESNEKGKRIQDWTFINSI